MALYGSILSAAKKILQSSKKEEKRQSILRIIDDAKWFEGKSLLKTIHKAILEASWHISRVF